MVESSIIKNLLSFTSSWQLVAGTWINTAGIVWILGETLHISLAAGGCDSLATLGPPGYLPAGHFWGKQPAGPPPGDNAPLKGLGCCEYPPPRFVPLPFSASFSPLCPLPTSPFSLTEYFPTQKSFAAVSPLVLPSRLAEHAVLPAGLPHRDWVEMLSFIHCGTK